MARSFERRSLPCLLGPGLLMPAFLCFVAACGSSPGGSEAAPPSIPDKEIELRDILGYESRRNPEARDRIVALTRNADPILRALAVRALGRAGGNDNTDVLLMSLGDPAWVVQKEALFALGQTQDPESRIKAEGVLLSKLGNTDGSARTLALVLEALGKLLDESSEARIQGYLTAPEPGVVAAASLALHRMRSRSIRNGNKRSEKADEILATALGKALTGTPTPETEWKLVYTLASLENRSSVDDLLRVAGPDHSLWSRLFAIRGLANIKREGKRASTPVRMRPFARSS